MGFRRDGDTHFQNGDDLVSPHTVAGHEVKDSDIMRMIPFDDTVIWDDGDDAGGTQLETQAMDIDGDTQLVDFDGETQVVDFDGETQALDFDEKTQALDFEGEIPPLDENDCNENLGTQILSDYDDALSYDGCCEELESTQTLCDNDYILEDEGLRGIDQLVDQETASHLCKPDEKNFVQVQDPDPLRNEKHHSEPHFPTSSPTIQGPSGSKSGPLKFTLIRAASLRASGLALRSMNKEKKVHAGSSILTQDHALESLSVATDGVNFKEHSCKDDIDEKNDGGTFHENSSRLTIVNKLKAGNSIARKLFTENTCSDGSETFRNERDTRKKNLLEVPSFECQVSGLSYANSQEPGEFSQTNALDFVDRFIQTSMKECDLDINHGKHTPEKGKSVSKINGLQSLAKNVKDKSTVEKSRVFDWDDTCEDEGGGEIFCRRKDDFFDIGAVRVSCTVPPKLNRGISNVYRNRGYSDSKLELCALKPSENYGQVHKVKTRKNLNKELDEELTIKESKVALVNDKDKTDKDGEQFSNVGFDTQAAAEAMEALCQGEEIHCPIGDAHHCLPNASENSLMSSVQKAKRGLNNKHNTPCKRMSMADVEFDSVEPKKRKISVEVQKELGKSRRRNKTTNQSVQEGIQKFVPIFRRTRLSLISNDAENPWGDDEAITHGTSGNRIGKSETISKVHAKVQKSKSKPNHYEELKNVELSPQTQPAQKSITKSDGSDILMMRALPRISARNLSGKFNSPDTNGKLMVGDFIEHNKVSLCERKSDEALMSSAQNPNCKDSPTKYCKPSNEFSATPDKCTTPVNAASPVCMGDDYFDKYFKKKPLKPRMIQEISSLSATGHLLSSTPNISRKRRDTTGIRVLYSQHLNDDIVNQQKKILSRLGILMASSITDATHFIADKFVRTRNMLEAIARSKSVVTHSWIESCGQANCFIDEKNHILRDTKKEKEFGFCMPLSLSRAAKHPLLKGQRVFITENTKPGKEIISSLVKAVEGQAVARVGRTALKNDKIPEDLMVLSCEEDYKICVPFLEKGAAIYSSELLLNGIVIQKLEFARHRLFADHVKRTRSTTWLKKDGNKFVAVPKSQ